MASNFVRDLPLDKLDPNHTGKLNLYSYVPTLWICALFVALFGLSSLIHTAQAIRYKMWWLLGTAVIAGIAEVMGWAARLWSSKNPTLDTPYLMQISTTILAPTPLVAANFIILGRLIGRLGPQYSRLSRHWYLIIFSSADAIALIVQAVGGAKASLAVRSHGDPEVGGHIMLGGIAFQMAAITVYMVLAVEFLLRFSWDRPLRRISSPKEGPTHYIDDGSKWMLFGLGLSSIAIFIRSVYRLIELIDGWTGRIITTQLYFNVLDGAMIVLAMFTLNILHPGFLLTDANRISNNVIHTKCATDSEIALGDVKDAKAKEMASDSIVAV